MGGVGRHSLVTHHVPYDHGIKGKGETHWIKGKGKGKERHIGLRVKVKVRRDTLD
jgi:hypothetical protein